MISLANTILMAGVLVVGCWAIKGYNFGDNQMNVRMGPEDGFLQARIGGLVPSSLTVCLRFYPNYNRHGDQIGLWNIRIPHDSRWPIFDLVCKARGRCSSEFHGTIVKEKEDAFPRMNMIRKWSSLCVGLDFLNNSLVAYYNGQEINRTTLEEERKESGNSMDYRFPSGYFSDPKTVEEGYVIEFGKYYYDNKPIIGQLGDINMWDRVLEKEEMMMYSGCMDIVEGRGNIINADFQFNKTGKLVTDIDIPTEKISCRKMWSYLHLVVHMSSLEGANDLCNKIELNSIGPMIEKAADYIEFSNEILELPAYRSRCWHGSRMLAYIPYVKQPGELYFQHLNNGAKLEVEAWTVWTKIKKKDEKECAAGYIGPAEPMNKSLATWDCEGNSFAWSPCFACNLIHSHTHSVVTKLTGVCDKSAFDQYYHLENDEEGFVIFYGFTGTIIRYDSHNKMWNISVSHKPEVTATSKALFESLTLGNHEWEIMDDNGCKDGVEQKVLTMSTCSTDQYTCNDGLCINLDYRCDGEPNCKDKSDELGCQLIARDNSYQKFLTPPPIGEKKKLTLKMEVDLISIGNIQEIESTVEFQFILYLTWLESRLKYLNLIANGTNRLTPTEMEWIWVPKLMFYNTDKRLETVLDDSTVISIKREGEFESLQNKRVYSGKDNPLISSRFYITQFMCIYNMAWYPFDTQRCSMVFVVDASSELFLDIAIEKLNFLGRRELTQYFVKKDTIYKSNIDGRKAIFVEIVLGRRLLSIILTIFAPTVILNLVGHTSNYFKEFFFEAVISVNVTVMLVLTTMLINVSNNLPKTAYIKMIDLWLLVSLIKPFLDIMLQTYIDYLRDDSKREINHHGKPRKVGEKDGVVKVSPVSDNVDMDKLRSIDEKTQRDALKELYSKDLGEARTAKIARMRKISSKLNPGACLVFVCVYWVVGMRQYYAEV